jgi:DnaJ-class molecular chaperone
MDFEEIECELCLGSGWIDEEPCPACGGFMTYIDSTDEESEQPEGAFNAKSAPLSTLGERHEKQHSTTDQCFESRGYRC